MNQTKEAAEAAGDAIHKCRAAVRALLEQTICAIMEQEIVLHLRERRMADAQYANARNGYKRKTLTSDFGSILARVPQDRRSDYEPILIGKYRKDVRDVEGAIFRLYAKGREARLAAARALYGTPDSRELAESVVRAIEPAAREIWSRSIEPRLALLCVDTAAYEAGSAASEVSVFTGVYGDGQARVLAVSSGTDGDDWRAALETLRERGLRAAARIEARGAAKLCARLDEAFPRESAEL